MAAGGSAIVVATPAHRAALGAALASFTATGGPAGRLLMADAAGMLSGFLAGDRLDAVRFRTAFVDLIGRAARAGQPVRIYAEMVALLGDAGRVALALELESLWNDLVIQLPFRLLCAYPARTMTGHDDEDRVAEVRRLHSEVVRPHAVRGFAPHLDSAREARHFVLSQLGSRADRALASDVAIVIAELAANAIVHAQSAFIVAVSHTRDAVRIAVRDMTPLGDGERLVTATGHGLDVVAKIAARWAVEPLPDGKVIWAELPRGERSPS
jgi:MEDS: MEthanogen/methylotroph, DcmR Sensory domain